MAEIPAFVQENVLLSGMTTFGIGGPARWFAQPATLEQLLECLRFAEERGIWVRMLGGGSNLLVADAGVTEMVIRLAARSDFADIKYSAGSPAWQVGAAAPLQALVGTAAREGAAGLESLAGIPGSVGGAVCMNAGAHEGGIGRFVAAATVVDSSGQMRVVVPPALSFSYRMSSLRGGNAFAVAFEFRFEQKGDSQALLARMRAFREAKMASQPVGMPSAGCIFKNPPAGPAGALLDAAGCKGMREGDAVVSDRHANFIVNAGRANARDVARLARRMRERVFGENGVTLETEVLLWGDEPAFAGLRGEMEP